jgi:acyl-CoA reductase-like NAD-dependent aldehyde dehydrogenase
VQGLDPDLRALQEVRDCVEAAHKAQKAIARWSQAQVDAACAAVAKAGAAAAYELAKLAVEETGIGRVHYKVLKNLFGSEVTWESIKDEKTVGVIARDERAGSIEIATPIGVVACIVPTTNPTSTALNNALISLKGRNAIVISPHPRARRCIAETVEVMRRALERAGAPADLLQVLSNPTLESTAALMKHPKIAIILATGGAGLVQAAYSSGKPAYGVGPGNVPVYIDRSADVKEAARWITSSQSFDNGTLCCSEQALVLDRPIADALLAEMRRLGAHLCSQEETDKLARYCNRRGHMNPELVGLDPWIVAEKAGFGVPRHTTVLLAHQGGVGPDWPLSIEILCPLLSIHVVDEWEEGCEVSLQILNYGGLGHTIGVWARSEEVLNAWYLEKPASRIVVNGPTSEGAVGFSTGLKPAMSLGCGPLAGNITSDNISARHMINVKRVGLRRRDWEEIYRKNHERAAALSGDRAPRGSGLPGDPALGGTSAVRASSAFAPGAASNWVGNTPSSAAPTRPPAPAGATGSNMEAKVDAAAKAWPTPTFTSDARAALTASAKPAAPVAVATGSGGAAASVATANIARAAAPAHVQGPYVGMLLSPSEVHGMLAHAGAGCPLGPCKGCAHHEVTTGACKA